MGHMSFVGPRPALFNQDDLIDLRTRAGVHVLTPGLTGWAQVNGRNALSWADKFRHDVWYVDHASPTLDCKILARTLLQLFRSGENHDPGKFMGTEEMKKPDTQSPP
jgi:O-antigen biosynthesis protein WbqP